MPGKLIVRNLDEIQKPWKIEYGMIKTKFGDVQLGILNGAVCFLYFDSETHLKSNIGNLRKRFPKTEFIENTDFIESIGNRIFVDDDPLDLEIVLAGTEFQNNVWRTLIEIRAGETWSYSECAEKMGRPSAVRAVANAVANNEISFLVPCHRVVSKDGNKLKYRWGGQIKKQILEHEEKIQT